LFKIHFLTSQKDESETLILGKIFADKYHMTIPKKANLGFVSINELVYEPSYIFQSYGLVKEYLPDIELKVEKINDVNWSNGIAKNWAGFVVKQDDRVSYYVGRNIFLQNGESRIITKISNYDKYANIYVSGTIIEPNIIDASETIKLSGKPIHTESILLTPYVSQYGIGGIMFSKLYAVFPSIKSLRTINCLFFSITIALLVLVYKRIISNDFAIIFFITINLSFWVMAVSRNLYWIPFSIFLPAVFSGFYFISRKNLHKFLSLVAVYAALLFKCLAGYEYISSVILFAAAIFVYELFNPERSISKLQSVKCFFIICFLGVAGFITALIMHADMRGNTIIEGLQSIYEMDVKRRTYNSSNINAFGTYVADSLSASPLSVVKTYIFDWKTEFLRFIPSSSFFILLLTSMVTILFRYYKGHKNSVRDAGLFIAFLMPPLSWFVLAKAHSYIHVHKNFMLWYLGFAAAIIYISFTGIKIAIINVVAWAGSTNPSKL
jgi:hypothetical protein